MLRASGLPLEGLLLLEPRVFRDERGYFVETYVEQRYRNVGVTVPFVQDNHSRSVRGTLRGMHFQRTPGQAKLVRVATGSIYDVVVDIRPSSPTFGKWFGIELDAVLHRQLFIPVGFAHGFCVTSDSADVIYKVSTPYDPTTEVGFHWADPAIGIRWPVDAPVVSPRDRDAPPLRELFRGAVR
ncbi:MAG: dTDP-4-dehydrorhamnose 3,5-epimerase [Kofleriaceae bacterium]